MTRARIRDLGITIGRLPTGQLNAITDVPGVLVGHTTVVHDVPSIARTGVTVVLPREGAIAEDEAFAAYYSFNGFGEMTGLPWLEESGKLGSAIGITNTYQVGLVRDAFVAYSIDKGYRPWVLPVVAETYDGFLSDIDGFHLNRDHVYQALDSATGGAVAEGAVGGGTGMICHQFKGGIGTSSRIADTGSGRYTVGSLVQANYGVRALLRVDGVPVGREIGHDHTPVPEGLLGPEGSIIVIVATDAPLLPIQCKRLAQRATVGLARTGGVGHNGSGDIFLAFATGNHLPAGSGELCDLQMVPHHQMDPLIEAVAEAVEESILNALAAGETTIGFQGRTIHALPHDELRKVMARYAPRD